MATGKAFEGVFAINKPVGLSSAQVIRDCQEKFNPSELFRPLLAQEQAARDREPKNQWRRRGKNKKELSVKMGHGGTLDPLATGVLILGVGKGTKQLSNFLGCTKSYETVALFGASTDTYDRVGRIIKKGDYSQVTREAVEEALKSFKGRIKQIPPLYSALKMNGKPLYEYAREGKAIPREIETREVDVAKMELVEWYKPGTHNHRWPAEEAEESEKKLVNAVWDVAMKQTGTAGSTETPLSEATPEEVEESGRTVTRRTKRKAEDQPEPVAADLETQPSKRPKMTDSEAVSRLPTHGPATWHNTKRGSNLVPAPPDPNTPPPWTGQGPPAALIRMTVTSGFYVRSLCHDLGEKLGCGAMMAELCRSRQGEFAVDEMNCLDYSDLEQGEDVWGPKVQSMLSAWMAKVDGASGVQKAAQETMTTDLGGGIAATGVVAVKDV